MADSALVDLTDGSTAQGTDIVYAVRDPSGTPVDRKISMANVLAYIVAQANTWTAGQTISGASLTLSGNQSAAAWTTSGIRIKGSAGTLTDTSSSGTVAAAYTNVLGGNTIAASSSTTFTDYYSTFLTEPTAGSNVTITNRWALGLTGGISIAQGTITNARNGIRHTATWNNAGTTFTGIFSNITNTASSASSLLMDLQVGGSTRFRVGKGTTGSIYMSGDGNGPLIDLAYDQAGIYVNGSGRLYFPSGATSGILARGYVALGASYGTAQAILEPGGTDILELRRTTNVQTFNWYGNYVSSTDYHRGALKVAKTTLSGVSGATVTATNLIPDGAVVVGVTTKVTTGLGTGNGTSGYQVGDGTDPDRWGQIAAVASGTTTDNTNATNTAVNLFAAATSVVITADGGNFDGTGVIDVNVFYLIAQAD